MIKFRFCIIFVYHVASQFRVITCYQMVQTSDSRITESFSYYDSVQSTIDRLSLATLAIGVLELSESRWLTCHIVRRT